MTKKGSESHENELKNRIKEYEKKGYRMIDLGGKSPDAIGVKIVEKKPYFIALDVVSAYTKKPSVKQTYFCKQKKTLYESLGFDEVFVFDYIPKRDN